MPHVGVVVRDVLWAAVFADIDFTSVFWPFLVHPESQNLYSSITADFIM